MSQPARLEERVSQLELEMAEVRYLATKANKDVSDFRTVLVGHTGVINAIREDQLEQGKKLARVEKEVHAGFARMNEEFADVRSEMRNGFGKLAEGQARITELITQHIEECDKD